MTTRQQMVAQARRYINAEFRLGGRSARRTDCVGIPLLLARDLKIAGWKELWEDTECHVYATVRPVGFLRAKLDSLAEAGILRRVDINKLAIADMVLRFGSFGHDHHVSLISRPGWIIEATNEKDARHPNGRLIETQITGRVARTFLGGYQFAGII